MPVWMRRFMRGPMGSGSLPGAGVDNLLQGSGDNILLGDGTGVILLG